MKCIFIAVLVILVTCVFSNKTRSAILVYFISKFVKSSHSVIFSCEQSGAKIISAALMAKQNFIKNININKIHNIHSILTYRIHAKTAVVLDCKCYTLQSLLFNASEYRFFNTTYNWILLDEDGACQHNLLHIPIKYLGPNAQITQIKLNNLDYGFFDIHSKGRHLGAPLQITYWAKAIKFKNASKIFFNTINPTFQFGNIKQRDNFNGITLRGASVIDRDNITSNSEINEIMRRRSKDVGVAAFSKYNYDILEILRERLNFKINFRNARGWAGRLENSTFRLGYIGIMQRNEVDIGASASYNRPNRFAELDIIEQSWVLETSFLFRFTPDLNKHNNKGNFLAPFETYVWVVVILTFLSLIVIWIWIEYSKLFISNRQSSETNKNGLYRIPLDVVAAFCQQGLDPIPKGVSSRIIIITMFVFSLVIYNYYTSSLVGGLLSNTAQGPTSVEEITASKLILSFEDIGYYKVLFRENKSPQVIKLLHNKILPPRDPNDLPVYSHIENAIPYLKRGGYAFHCEVVDAYPEISKLFDASEICDLREVSGLVEKEILNNVVTKNSQYTEIFRIIIRRAQETGLIKQLLNQKKSKKPKCQGMYTVYPVSFSEITDAFILFAVGLFASLVAVIVEIYWKKLRRE